MAFVCENICFSMVLTAPGVSGNRIIGREHRALRTQERMPNCRSNEPESAANQCRFYSSPKQVVFRTDSSNRFHSTRANPTRAAKANDRDHCNLEQVDTTDRAAKQNGRCHPSSRITTPARHRSLERTRLLEPRMCERSSKCERFPRDSHTFSEALQALQELVSNHILRRYLDP